MRLLGIHDRFRDGSSHFLSSLVYCTHIKCVAYQFAPSTIVFIWFKSKYIQMRRKILSKCRQMNDNYILQCVPTNWCSNKNRCNSFTESIQMSRRVYNGNNGVIRCHFAYLIQIGLCDAHLSIQYSLAVLCIVSILHHFTIDTRWCGRTHTHKHI